MPGKSRKAGFSFSDFLVSRKQQPPVSCVNHKSVSLWIVSSTFHFHHPSQQLGITGIFSYKNIGLNLIISPNGISRNSFHCGILTHFPFDSLLCNNLFQAFSISITSWLNFENSCLIHEIFGQLSDGSVLKTGLIRKRKGKQRKKST